MISVSHSLSLTKNMTGRYRLNQSQECYSSCQGGGGGGGASGEQMFNVGIICPSNG